MLPGRQASSVAWIAAVSSVVPSPVAPWSLTFTHPGSVATPVASPAETAVADTATAPTASADLSVERREFGPVAWRPMAERRSAAGIRAHGGVTRSAQLEGYARVVRI